MSLFSRPETVVLKEGSSSRRQLEALEALRGTLPPAAEKRLETDIPQRAGWDRGQGSGHVRAQELTHGHGRAAGPLPRARRPHRVD